MTEKPMSRIDGIEWSRENNITLEDWMVCPYCGSDDVECRYANADDGSTSYECQNCGLNVETY